MPSNQSNSHSNRVIVTNHLKKGLLPSSTTDLITFQFNESCVLVKPTEDYQDAITTALKEFYELSGIPRERIAFSVTEVGVNGERRALRVSEGAWSTLVAKLPQGSVIHITVRPDPDAKAPPPQYLEVPVPSVHHSYLGLRHSRSDSGISSHPHSKPNGILSWLGSGK